MQFIRTLLEGQPRIGVLRDDQTVAVSATDSRLEDHFGDDGSALLAVGERIVANPAHEASLQELDLLAPVRPSSMRDFMVFEEHILPLWRSRGSDRGPEVWYERPIGYFSNAAAIVGPRAAVEIPGGSDRLDFELEIGAVVGREARSVTPEQAGQHIAGYVILCDWSARDLQMREMQGALGPFKGKDFASSLGSVFITADQIEPLRKDAGFDLRMESAVNGRSYGGDSWASASWSFEDLLSYASWNSVVEAGGLLGSGTCQGGCISELATRNPSGAYPWLQAGDEVVLTVELLGDLRTTILPPARAQWPGLRIVPELPGGYPA